MFTGTLILPWPRLNCAFPEKKILMEKTPLIECLCETANSTEIKRTSLVFAFSLVKLQRVEMMNDQKSKRLSPLAPCRCFHSLGASPNRPLSPLP